LEWYFENNTLPILNDIGGVVKKVNDTMNVTFTFANETEGLQVPLALASTYVEPQPAAQESNGLVYAGVAFGVVAILAAGALIKNCRTQKANSNQEYLL
jgi:hypothetical protein